MSRNITELNIDGEQQITRNDQHMEEMHIAIADFVHENHFRPKACDAETYSAVLSKDDQRILLKLQAENADKTSILISMSTKPLRSLMKDYFLMVESYQQAIRDHDTRKIEAVDVGRRGIHNEGAKILQDMLVDKVDMDFCTARRLFTLISIMHMK